MDVEEGRHDYHHQDNPEVEVASKKSSRDPPPPIEIIEIPSNSSGELPEPPPSVHTERKPKRSAKRKEDETAKEKKKRKEKEKHSKRRIEEEPEDEAEDQEAEDEGDMDHEPSEQKPKKKKKKKKSENEDTGKKKSKKKKSKKQDTEPYRSSSTHDSADILAEYGQSLDDEEEDVVEKRPLAENVYSLMFISDYSSQAFFFSLLVFLFQLALLALLFVNLTDFTDSSNRTTNGIRIPAGVDIEVVVANFFAMVLLVAKPGDLVASLTILLDGHDRVVMLEKPSATFSKWFLAAFSQFLAGALLMANGFILIVQSTTIFRLLLNFAVLTVLSSVDDVLFGIAMNGFFTNSLQHASEEVSDYLIRTHSNRNVYRFLIYASVSGAVLIAYAAIAGNQLSGTYLCDHISVQYGGAFLSFLPYYSDTYHQLSRRINRRRAYRDSKTGDITIAYCNREQAWTVSLTSSNDICQYLAKSAETTSYDLLSTEPTDWLVLRSLDEKEKEEPSLVPLDWLAFQCIDCVQSACSVNQGACSKGLCDCSEERFGPQCEFQTSDLCPVLTRDLRTPPFPDAADGTDVLADKTFSLLTDDSDVPMVAYDKPVFFTDLSATERAFMLFLGGRWFIFATDSEINPWDIERVEELMTTEVIDFFRGDIHVNQLQDFPLRLQTRPHFVSSAVNRGSPLDRGTPIGLSWYWAGLEPSDSASLEVGVAFRPLEEQPIGTSFLCASCDERTNTCLNAPCSPEGVCDCSYGFVGSMCEFEPKCNDPDFSDVVQCMNEGTCNENGECECASKMIDLDDNRRREVTFTGRLCQHAPKCFDFEEDGPDCFIEGTCTSEGCFNDGICTQVGTCSCTPPFEGDLCQAERNCYDNEINGVECFLDGTCKSGGCDNLGVCTPNGYCLCDGPFSGYFCENVPPCYELEEDGFSCFERDSCTNEGCLNNGVCNQDGRCTCPDNYEGNLCQDSPSCFEFEEDRFDCFQLGTCTNRGCDNGGICSRNGYCTCPELFSGYYCEDAPRCTEVLALSEEGEICFRNQTCTTNGCFNNGICTFTGRCTCSSPFGGDVCQYSYEDSFLPQELPQGFNGNVPQGFNGNG